MTSSGGTNAEANHKYVGYEIAEAVAFDSSASI